MSVLIYESSVAGLTFYEKKEKKRFEQILLGCLENSKYIEWLQSQQKTNITLTTENTRIETSRQLKHCMRTILSCPVHIYMNLNVIFCCFGSLSDVCCDVFFCFRRKHTLFLLLLLSLVLFGIRGGFRFQTSCECLGDLSDYFAFVCSRLYRVT